MSLYNYYSKNTTEMIQEFYKQIRSHPGNLEKKEEKEKGTNSPIEAKLKQVSLKEFRTVNMVKLR